MLKWFAALSGIIGALLVAQNAGHQFIGYLFFLAGGLAWLKVSITCKDWPSLLQWSLFSAINFWGVLNYAG